MDNGDSSSLPTAGDNAQPPLLPRFLPAEDENPTEQIGNTKTTRHPPKVPNTTLHQRSAASKTSMNSTSNPTQPKPSATNATPLEHATTPKKSNAQDMQYTPVSHKKGKSKEKRHLPTTGILLTRIGSRRNLAKQSVNMQDILMTLLAIDQHASILPHNCNHNRIMRIDHMLKHPQDYTMFMDISLSHWGKPNENKSRIAMSFYIASDIIVDGLLALKKSPQFQSVLQKFKLNISPHTLLQTESKAVAFFSGKSPAHTWREDLRRRFASYLNEHLHDPMAVKNIFGQDADVPTDIPFYFKVTTVRNQKNKATAIAVYVGKTHHAFMQQLIAKEPFEDVVLVLLSQQRHEPEIYDKQILLH